MKKVLVFLLIGVLVLTGCSFGGDDAKKYNININAYENIEVRTYVDYEEDYLIVYMTNNNSYDIGNFETKAVYYDKDGNELGDDYVLSFDFKSGSDYVVALDLPHDDDYNNFVPEKIELSVEVDEEYQDVVELGTLYNDKVSTSYKELGNEIEVTINNNSGNKIDELKVAVLFMKKNKPIAFDELSGRFDVGESDTGIIKIPVDWKKSESSQEDILIKYDSIKIIVNRASNY